MSFLDMNTCVYIMNKKPEAAHAKFEAVSLSDISISSITLFELGADARKGSKAKENL